MKSVSELRSELQQLDFDDKEDVEHFTTKLRQYLESGPGKADLFIRQNLRRLELDPSNARAYRIVRHVEGQE